MPDMGHGSSPTTVERIDLGSYRARDVYFVMPGKWELPELRKLGDKVQGLFTSIRLFTRGKIEEALAKKKALSKKMHSRVQKMVQAAKRLFQSRQRLSQQGKNAKAERQLYEHMLKQIKIWMTTGFHPKDKIISLWDPTSRAISSGKK